MSTMYIATQSQNKSTAFYSGAFTWIVEQNNDIEVFILNALSIIAKETLCPVAVVSLQHIEIILFNFLLHYTTTCYFCQH